MQYRAAAEQAKTAAGSGAGRRELKGNKGKEKKTPKIRNEFIPVRGSLKGDGPEKSVLKKGIFEVKAVCVNIFSLTSAPSQTQAPFPTEAPSAFPTPAPFPTEAPSEFPTPVPFPTEAPSQFPTPSPSISQAPTTPEFALILKIVVTNGSRETIACFGQADIFTGAFEFVLPAGSSDEVNAFGTFSVGNADTGGGIYCSEGSYIGYDGEALVSATDFFAPPPDLGPFGGDCVFAGTFNYQEEK